MALRPVSDVSVADWYVDDPADDWAKVVLGPSCFTAYARVLYRLDDDAPPFSDTTVRTHVREVLARFTTTPDEAFFGLWDGNGHLGEHELDGPKVRARYRDYLLFSGSLAPAIDWGAAELSPGVPRGDMDGPHLMWPADHAWFMASDVDPDWLAVGGSEALIAELLADDRLDAVRATYGPRQPEYR